jgi:carbohydrate-binding DOMON domain-containing protein
VSLSHASALASNLPTGIKYLPRPIAGALWLVAQNSELYEPCRGVVRAVTFITVRITVPTIVGSLDWRLDRTIPGCNEYAEIPVILVEG